MTSSLSKRISGRPAQQTTQRLLSVGIVSLLLSGCATDLGGQAAQNCPPEIAAPILRVGDTWRWEDDKGTNFARRYIRQTSDGLFEADTRPGGPRFFYDNSHTLQKVFRDGQWIAEPSAEYPDIGRPVLAFPLHPGKSWSSTLLARSSVGNELLTYRVTYTVLGCEQVTVPAGTVFAVAIKETQALVADPARAWGDRTSWYAPEVKYFVKRVTGPAAHPGYWTGSRDIALISFQIDAQSGRGGQPQKAAPAPQPSTERPTQPGVSPTPPPQQDIGPPPKSAILPIWERGYEWKYRWTSPRGIGTFLRTIVGEEQIGGVMCYVMRSGNRETLYSKNELAWLLARVEGSVETRATPANRDLVWPLSVGSEWEDKYQWENIPQRSTQERLHRHRVEGVETVTVPAGTFHTFKVISRSPTGRTTWEYWYSPEVKWLVKERMFLSSGVEEWELLEYRLIQAVGSSPAPPTSR